MGCPLWPQLYTQPKSRMNSGNSRWEETMVEKKRGDIVRPHVFAYTVV